MSNRDHSSVDILSHRAEVGVPFVESVEARQAVASSSSSSSQSEFEKERRLKQQVAASSDTENAESRTLTSTYEHSPLEGEEDIMEETQQEQQQPGEFEGKVNACETDEDVEDGGDVDVGSDVDVKSNKSGSVTEGGGHSSSRGLKYSIVELLNMRVNDLVPPVGGDSVVDGFDSLPPSMLRSSKFSQFGERNGEWPGDNKASLDDRGLGSNATADDGSQPGWHGYGEVEGRKYSSHYHYNRKENTVTAPGNEMAPPATQGKYGGGYGQQSARVGSGSHGTAVSNYGGSGGGDQGGLPSEFHPTTTNKVVVGAGGGPVPGKTGIPPSQGGGGLACYQMSTVTDHNNNEDLWDSPSAMDDSNQAIFSLGDIRQAEKEIEGEGITPEAYAENRTRSYMTASAMKRERNQQQQQQGTMMTSSSRHPHHPQHPNANLYVWEVPNNNNHNNNRNNNRTKSDSRFLSLFNSNNPHQQDGPGPNNNNRPNNMIDSSNYGGGHYPGEMPPSPYGWKGQQQHTNKYAPYQGGVPPNSGGQPQQIGLPMYESPSSRGGGPNSNIGPMGMGGMIAKATDGNPNSNVQQRNRPTVDGPAGALIDHNTPAHATSPPMTATEAGRDLIRRHLLQMLGVKDAQPSPSAIGKSSNEPSSGGQPIMYPSSAGASGSAQGADSGSIAEDSPHNSGAGSVPGMSLSEGSTTRSSKPLNPAAPHFAPSGTWGSHPAGMSNGAAMYAMRVPPPPPPPYITDMCEVPGSSPARPMHPDALHRGQRPRDNNMYKHLQGMPPPGANNMFPGSADPSLLSPYERQLVSRPVDPTALYHQMRQSNVPEHHSHPPPVGYGQFFMSSPEKRMPNQQPPMGMPHSGEAERYRNCVEEMARINNTKRGPLRYSFKRGSMSPDNRQVAEMEMFRSMVMPGGGMDSGFSKSGHYKMAGGSGAMAASSGDSGGSMMVANPADGSAPSGEMLSGPNGMVHHQMDRSNMIHGNGMRHAGGNSLGLSSGLVGSQNVTSVPSNRIGANSGGGPQQWSGNTNSSSAFPLDPRFVSLNEDVRQFDGGMMLPPGNTNGSVVMSQQQAPPGGQPPPRVSRGGPPSHHPFGGNSFDDRQSFRQQTGDAGTTHHSNNLVVDVKSNPGDQQQFGPVNAMVGGPLPVAYSSKAKSREYLARLVQYLQDPQMANHPQRAQVVQEIKNGLSMLQMNENLQNANMMMVPNVVEGQQQQQQIQQQQQQMEQGGNNNMMLSSVNCSDANSEQPTAPTTDEIQPMNLSQRSGNSKPTGGGGSIPSAYSDCDAQMHQPSESDRRISASSAVVMSSNQGPDMGGLHKLSKSESGMVTPTTMSKQQQFMEQHQNEYAVSGGHSTGPGNPA